MTSEDIARADSAAPAASSRLVTLDAEYLSRLVAALPDALIATDSARHIRLFNHAAERLFAATESQALGSPIDDWVQPSNVVETPRTAYGAMVELTFGRSQQRGFGLGRDGRQFPIELLSAPLRGADACETVYVVRDISSRLRAESELREYTQLIEEARAHHDEQTVLLEIQGRELAEARRRAEDSNRAKSLFLANMSHEIRTPMTSILGYAELLVEMSDCPEAAEAAETIRRNGGYLIELINDILDLSKIEAGKLSLERVRCSLSAIIDDVVDMMRMRAESQGLSLSVDYDGEFPETIETAPTRVRQILINLLGNAVKFTRRGSVRVALSCVHREQAEPQLQVQVIDTGIGMSDQQMEKLFQPFTQAEPSINRQFGGTGLGLTISRRLAEELGGSLIMSSELGVGSVFTLRLPIGPAAGVRWQAAERRASTRPAPAPPGDGSLRIPGRILLAEDGPDNQRLISHVLRKAGAAVEVVEDGRAAVDVARAAASADQPFDVILMDVQMPRMDGIEATQELRRGGYDRPIVALTAHAMSGDRERFLAAGYDDYASKPIDRVQLLGLIQRFLAPSEATLTR